jgi:plastocyanin
MTLGRRLAAAVAVVLLVGTTNAFAAADVTSVNIVDAPRPQPKWGYAPGTQKVQAGTWVTWSNNGQDAHTVTAVDGSFDSGNLDPSEGFSWFFDQPGTFAYVCALHPWMTGKIVVGDGLAPPPPPDDVAPPPPDEAPPLADSAP